MPSFLPDHCITLSRVISPSICEEIIELGKKTYTDYGQIGGGEDGFEDHFTRKSGVAWLNRELTLSDGKTVFEHITPHIRQVNADIFKFDLFFLYKKSFFCSSIIILVLSLFIYLLLIFLYFLNFLELILH